MADLVSKRLSSSMLGAILLRPSLSFASSLRALQQRSSSGVSRLTKLHRKQKAALREERAQSAYRAPFVAAPLSTDISSNPATAETSTPEPSPSHRSNLTYHVKRTKSKNFPVYLEAKGGGTRHLTLIRKISGDLRALKTDLTTALPPLTTSGPRGAVSGEAGGVSRGALRRVERTGQKGKDAEQVSINSTTGHLVVKGWRKAEIEKFLADRGF